MSNKSSKLIVGCGITFGVFIAIIVIGVFVLYNLVKDTAVEAEKIQMYDEAMEARFGKITEFTPSPNEIIISERLVLFLDIRDSLSNSNSDLVETFKTISSKIDKDEETTFWESIGLISTGLNILPEMLDYYEYRNRLLLRYEMGLGEYSYFYVLSYYSFLQNSLEDGPLFEFIGSIDGGGDLSFKDDHEDKDDYIKRIKTERVERISHNINFLFTSLLTNQLSVMDSMSENYKIINNELDLLKEDSNRIPWSDGLPKEIENYFAVFNKKLEETYQPLLSTVELRKID